MNKFLHSITLENGAVVGALFDFITSDDLPRVPGVAGGYTNASIVVDQIGRVISAASGAAPGITIGQAITGGRSDGSVLYEDSAGKLAISPVANAFFYDHAGSIGPLATKRTLYVGDGTSDLFPGCLAIWSHGTAEWVKITTDNATGFLQLSIAGDQVTVPGGLNVHEGVTVWSGGLLLYGETIPTGNILLIQSAAFADLFRIDKNGYFMVKKTAAPADGDLSASEVSLWWTNTVGATQVNFKGKDSAATVISHVLKGSNTGDQTITLTGDVTGSGTGSFAATIANSAVTLAKIANAAANSKLLGSGASGSGSAYVEITLGTGLSMSSTTLNVSLTAGSGTAAYGGPDPITSQYPVFTGSGVDDEFDDASFSGWTLVNDGTHLATNTETNNVLSILLPGSDTSAHLQAYMKTVTVNVGDIIEIALQGMGENANFQMAGLIFADGTTYAAGNQVCWAIVPSQQNLQLFAQTNYNTQGTNTSKGIGTSLPFAIQFLRLKYVSANNFAGYGSCDGISWVNMTGTVGRTCTPSAVGFFVTSWGSSVPYMWTVRYFRKTT